MASSARAISIVHPDGALVSVVGRPSDMEARSIMPAEGFSGFAAKAAGLLEVCKRMQVGGQTQGGGNPQAFGQQQVPGPGIGFSLSASWDGKRLIMEWSLVSTTVQPQITRQHVQPQIQLQVQPQGGDVGSVNSPVLVFCRSPAVWDPRNRLVDAAQNFLRSIACGGLSSDGIKSDESAGALARTGGSPAVGTLAAGTLAAELRALLVEAYAAGRRAEGLHGTGAFATGFRRLEAHPDFPAVAVGFGPGTTPAGDDWLAGCLVALDLRAGGPAKAAVLLRQKVRDRLEQTTAAGRSLLLGALAGTPPEYLVALAEAASDFVALAPAAGWDVNVNLEAEAKIGQHPGPGGLRAAVSNCLTHGATSGEDALAGFVYGLETDMELMKRNLSMEFEP